jgi:hypothetical protein
MGPEKIIQMLTEFSKPSQDVAHHTAFLIEQNRMLLDRQRKIAATLHGAPDRSLCIICMAALDGSPTFQHRGVPYTECATCGHIQCSAQVPDNYPYSEQDFADIYRPLDAAAYAERTSRIYAPKRDWALRSARATALGDLLGRSWVELGSGAGYFLSALRAAGANRIAGVEAELPLVAQAGAMLGGDVMHHFSGSLGEAVQGYPAEVYAAWFVLEHCLETAALLDALRDKPRGTVFMFSVPTYGLATLLESACDGHYARSLDSVLHTQLFTDRSIQYAMGRAGYEIKAEWLFGQDADDLYRALVAKGELRAPQGVIARLGETLSEIQSAIDRARLSDSRHILAVRT